MRKLALAVMVVGVLAATVVPVAAGGFDTFTMRRNYFAPGEAVSWEQSIYVKGLKGPEDGPWHAYLRPERDLRRDWGLDDEAVRVGTVEITESANRNYVDASLNFTVPANTEPGYYGVQVCNEPNCRKWLGALGPTEVGIARTPVEAHLLRRVEWLKSDIFTLRYEQRRAPRTGEVRGMVSTVRAALTDAKAESANATNGLENELAALEARLARSEDQPLLGPSEWLL
ncbi:MAG: hypothetical protein ACRDKZ_13860, partial [Actinomycetota bacterium]